MPTVTDIRRAMAAKGWNSDDRLTNQGWGDKGYGYSLWLWRYNWHDHRCDKVTFHGHGSGYDAIARVTQRAAALAQFAWDEFPETKPHQNPDGWGVIPDYVMPSWSKPRDREPLMMPLEDLQILDPDPAMELRWAMTEQGWSTETRLLCPDWIAKFPKYAPWEAEASRSKWHGQRVGFHVGFEVSDQDPGHALEVIQRVHDVAHDAWIRFPTCVPELNDQGILVPCEKQPDWAVIPKSNGATTNAAPSL